MKNHHSIRSYLLGVLTTLMVLILAAPALAAAAQKTIQVSSGVRIYIDDTELRPSDANGNPVEVFVYNGTTYLPVRAVSEGLGKPVQWDGGTRSVYIGKHSSDAPAAYLSQMDYFTQSGRWSFETERKDNLGVSHTHTISGSNFDDDITYKLNGEYQRLTATFFQRYEKRNSTYSKTLIISGDGRDLWQGTMSGGTEPVDIDIDITGVLELKLEYVNNNARADSSALGEVALWS